MAGIVVASIAASLLLASTAHAEQGCPDGFIPNGAGTPGVPCVAGRGWEGQSQEPQPQPRGRWATRWGAFAKEEETGKIGMAGSMSSEGKAKKAAIAHCKSKGGVNCQIALTYYNQCAVVVSGEKNNGEWATRFQSAATLEEASGLAEDSCREAGGAGCKVFFSDCSYAEFVE